ncbi:MAG: stage II sporulation protein P [Defluviitaleaceae bacterium]|nr:stage II sporulation protein P [Defluviitaleaceae bacterium]
MPKKIHKSAGKKTWKGLRHIKSLSTGLVASIFLLFAISFFNDILSGELFLHEALPHYTVSSGLLNLQSTQVIAAAEIEMAAVVDMAEEAEPEKKADAEVVIPEIIPPLVVGINDVVIDYGTTEYISLQNVMDSRNLAPPNLEDLRNPDILRNTMYIVDPRTAFLPEMFDVDRFLEQDLRVNPVSLAVGDPVVLIFHTHSTEFFVDSDTNDKFTGIVGVGAHLAQLLNDRGIGTIHMTQRFDIVDGQSRILGAYERQVPYIRRILEKYPTIEVVIDLHRDGLPAGAPRLVTDIDGKPTAQIMFFNGLSLFNDNGVPTPLATLPNPNLPYNLAFSFQMQLMANNMFDNFTRRIYLNAFRYSLHFKPKSLLVEIGAQTNTFQEAINATYPLAEILANVIK